jgi:hypothetical protein
MFGGCPGTRSFLRVFLFPVRPNLCWIGLFPLDFRHLAERMFFARNAKQEHAEQNTEENSAEQTTHNALPQLPVSRVVRKNESALVKRVTPCAPLHESKSKSTAGHFHNGIETRRYGITIQRGGPHRQK